MSRHITTARVISSEAANDSHMPFIPNRALKISAQMMIAASPRVREAADAHSALPVAEKYVVITMFIPAAAKPIKYSLTASAAYLASGALPSRVRPRTPKRALLSPPR